MSLGERLRNEVREIGLVTLYFLVAFSLFLTLKKLFLEEYHVRVALLSTLVIAALVTAKVVVILNKTSAGERFKTGPLYRHILYRSLVYIAFVLLVTGAERVFDFYRETGSLGAAFEALWKGRNLDHFLAMNLCVAVSFLVYNTFTQLDQRLGEGELRRLLFAGRT